MPRKQLDPEQGIIRSFMRLPVAAAGKLLSHMAAMHEGRLLGASATTTAATAKAARKPKAKPAAAVPPQIAAASRATAKPQGAPAQFAPENTAAHPTGPRRRGVPLAPGTVATEPPPTPAE